MSPPRFDRRKLLTGGLGAALALSGPSATLMRKHGHHIARHAASVKPAGSDLGAVEHVVFLMHENRSFDHYFGRLGTVDGFDTASPAFAQAWPGGASSTLLPYHLDSTMAGGTCSFDLDHTWKAQHLCWNNGAMDSFVSTHVSSAYEGAGYGPLTMAYYDERDIPFYYALARSFTICDKYFCSVLGPTHPNRLMQMTGTIDPAGVAGGPILVTSSDSKLEFTCTWETMPEILQEHNVSWRVYNPHGVSYNPGNANSLLIGNNPLLYMKNFTKRANGALHKNAFAYHGLGVPTDAFNSGGKDHFAADVKHNRLPAVSWIMPPLGYDEHPPAPSVLGEWYTAQIVSTLMSNPKVWSKTVLFVMYDENDGLFDHVAPPTAPPGTPGEYVTKTPAPSPEGGFNGPIGLGVRVPMLVVSPFSRGGWVCSDVLDHTSQLQFISQRWGVPLPSGLSQWRRNTVGDLTGALPLTTPNTGIPTLPKMGNVNTLKNSGSVAANCTSLQLLEANTHTNPVIAPPATQSQPTQDGTVLQRTPA
jgi:phospholipase C